MKISEIGTREVLIDGCDMSLADTFGCGQCFRWEFDGEGWRGVAMGRAVRCVQRENGFIIENTSIEEAKSLWYGYFDLGRDYGAVTDSIGDDEYLSAAAKFGRGIRILRQEPLETIISFIISSNNNIKRIRGIIERFCVLYGKPVNAFGGTFYAFPDYEDLKRVTMEGLTPLRAGFRQKYIMDAAEKINSGELDPDGLCGLSTEEASAELMKIKGIGEKVSDCILLFGFGRYEVFPKDIWIKRVLSDVYGGSFDENAFGENAGIVQQYLYHYARCSGTKK